MSADEAAIIKAAQRELITNLMGEVNSFFRKEAKVEFDVLKPASQVELNFVRTGSRALDRALGGGLARGRTVEFIGELATLKTYFAQTTLANAQEAGMRTAFLDAEGTFEAARAEQLGVDTDELFMIDRRLRGDESLDVVCSLLDQGNFFIIVDSVAALLPREESEKRIGEDTMARQAAMMSRAMRKITQANRDGVMLFINQLRENIGISFGPRNKAPGGKALGFYATHRVRFAKIETIKGERGVYIGGKLEKKQVEVAFRIQAKIEKSKVGRPLQEAVFLFDLETGEVDHIEELLNLSLEYGLITADGAQHYIVTTTGERVRWRRGIVDLIQQDPSDFEVALDKQLYGTKELPQR